ncbi:MAG TPA: DUF924 family protein [Beijerinckiaceae bacterium]
MASVEKPVLATPDEVISFWREAGPDRWFAQDHAFDHACRARFLGTYEAAARGDLNEWELSPEGALAVVLLLDQFPRNMFRGTRRAFATDPAALDTADRAVTKGFDAAIDPPLRRFFYMPFMHAEDLGAQDRCVRLAREAGQEETLRYAELHRDLIARFGRFPHRNAVLGRASTPEEEAYLAEEGAFRG